MVTAGLYIGLPATYAIFVTDLSRVATSGAVTVTDVLPAGLTDLNRRRTRLDLHTCTEHGHVHRARSRAQSTVTCTTSRTLSARSITTLAILANVTRRRAP